MDKEILIKSLLLDFLADMDILEKESFKISIMNRERTNHDSSFQAEYFYGSSKYISKEQAFIVSNTLISVDNFLILNNISKKDYDYDLNSLFVKIFCGNNSKEYFKNIKSY
jgi:hypothetical protein